VTIAGALSALFAMNAVPGTPQWQIILAAGAAVVLGASLFPLARLFTRDSDEEKKAVAAFFAKLDRPVDVQAEVYGSGRKQVATLPIVGRTIIFLGILVSMAFLNSLGTTEAIAVSAMVSILLGFGGTLWLAGRRVAAREAAEEARIAAGGAPAATP